MRRPAGVIFAAIVMALITVFGLITSIPTLFFAIFSHNRIIPTGGEVRLVLVVIALLMVGFFLLCAWTVVSLLGMKRSARVAAVIIGGIIFVFSGLSGLGILFARQYAAMLPAGPAAGNVQDILIGAAAFYLLVACIGLWWLVYFNLASVRTAFIEANVPWSASAPAPVSRFQP